MTKHTSRLIALLSLSVCWSHAAGAVAQTQTPAPITQPPGAQEPSTVVAGALPPQAFTIAPHRYQLPPRDYLNSSENGPRIIDPTPPRTTRDRGLSFGPIIIRRDPNPDPGCRFGIRGARLQLRCVR